MSHSSEENPGEPEPLLVPGRIPAVGTLTRLVARRGLEDFLEAARLLVEAGVEARYFVAGEGPLDPSCYDLLAPEASRGSFVAIAKGDVSPRHWFLLGRALTPCLPGALRPGGPTPTS